LLFPRPVGTVLSTKKSKQNSIKVEFSGQNDPKNHKMKRGVQAGFKPPRPAMKKQKTSGLQRQNAVVGYQVGRSLSVQPKQELKAFDVAVTTTNVDVVAAPPNFLTNLNCPINGAELYQRVGRKIYMKSLHLKGWLQIAATALQDFVRIVVYYDSQPNAAAPTFAQLFQDSNAAAGSSFLSEINLVNRERFQILRNIEVLTPSSTYAAGVQTNTAYPETNGRLRVNEFIPLKGLETIFNATNGGTVADISSGALGFVVFSSENSNSVTFQWSSRLRYYD